jgi:hypothetical protein
MSKPEKKCFVLMPFKSEMKEVYDEVYVPVCKKNDIKCWRVDEISRPGSITRDIVEGILDADIIIADLTEKNANVFYELGIAHSAGNKTIMTAQSRDDVPFDIASYRVIFYSQSIIGCRDLFKKMDEAIRELVTALDRTNNPFQEVIAQRGGLRTHTKTPLVKVVNFVKLSGPLKEFLASKKIIYVEDLRSIDLEEVANRPGFGSSSKEQLCSLLLHLDSYDNAEKVHAFILKNHLDTTSVSYLSDRLQIPNYFR